MRTKTKTKNPADAAAGHNAVENAEIMPTTANVFLKNYFII